MLICGGLISSCQRNLILSHSNTTQVQDQIFGIHDSLVKINVDFKKNTFDAFTQIDSHFNYNICHQLTPFAYPLSTGELLKLYIIKDCPEDWIICRQAPHFKINMNTQGKILIKNDILNDISEISTLMVDNFPNERVGERWITFKWTDNIPIDSLEKVFTSIKIGYLKIYQNVARHLYNGQSFYKINRADRDSILLDLPHKIVLDIGSFGFPLPPPPPIAPLPVISSQ